MRATDLVLDLLDLVGQPVADVSDGDKSGSGATRLVGEKTTA
jgi:hypothetical protein